MHYKKITYQRVRNLGNYESSRLEITIELNEDDDVDTAIDKLKSKVKDKLIEKTKFSDDDEIPFN